ncbi:hypothetical protein ACIOEX_01705 [Streptomyces sp. NPDC087850]|uniref:hypothetical protein n=1 Tax=Streptomyces sp. NPDC087850 TaxID=3365809 RepID=UPI0037FF5C21
MSRRAPKLRLADYRLIPEPVTVAEWDATPGLREWIEQRIAAATDVESRWGATHRKILAAHPYSMIAGGRAGFGCDTCHVGEYGGTVDDGNCATILALAEGYGLEPADGAEVEVHRD